MLLSIQPITFIHSTIREIVNSKPMLFVIQILPFIFSVIRPLINSIAMHVVHVPFSMISPAIIPFVNSKSWDVIFFPISCVLRAVCPDVNTYSVFLSTEIAALVHWGVSPDFLSYSFLNIVFPLTLIYSSISMLIRPVPISFWMLEFSLIDVSIWILELAYSMNFSHFPVSFEQCSVRPFLSPKSVSKSSFPLTFIDSTALVYIWVLLCSLIWKQSSWTNRFPKVSFWKIHWWWFFFQLL